MKVIEMFYAEYLSIFLPLASGTKGWDILSTKKGVVRLTVPNALAEALGY